VTAGDVLPDLSACRELASALRAGDDSAAEGLAARTGIPRWLLTHPELGHAGGWMPAMPGRRSDASRCWRPDAPSTSCPGRPNRQLCTPPEGDDGPASREAAGRRLGVEDVPPPGPRRLIVEGYFLPVEHGLDDVAREINHELGYRSVLESRDAADLTPAEAVAAGGAALDRVLAMIDDCDWRLRPAEAEGKDTSMLLDPGELRRRLGIPAGSRRAVT
jgi:hypothetical protein